MSLWHCLTLGVYLFHLGETQSTADYNQHILHGLKEEGNKVIITDCPAEDECQEDEVREAVCASNGQTFDSLCQLRKEVCHGKQLKFQHFGECTVMEKCLMQRQEALIHSKGKTGFFLPRCLDDGSFAPLQCHNDTGFCWCVKPDGKSVPGSVTHNSNPADCSALLEAEKNRSRGHSLTAIRIYPDTQGTEDANVDGSLRVNKVEGDGRLEESPSLPPNQQNWPSSNISGSITVKESSLNNGCSGKVRNRFNKKLLKTLRKEYMRKGNKNAGKKAQKALEFKFLELDKDANDVLTTREYKGLKGLVRKHIRPQKCAEKFPDICDTNGNNRVSKEEWLSCFSESGNSAAIESEKKESTKDSSAKPAGRSGMSRKRPCDYDFKQTTGISGIYRPRCDQHGYYERVQCFEKAAKKEKHCFCVDTNTGNMINNTYMKNAMPNCFFFVQRNPWPKCEAKEKEEEFLHTLLTFFVKSADKMKRRNSGLSMKLEEQRAVEKVFDKLDEDHSGFLEKSEKRKLRRIVTKESPFKNCARRIHKVCDFDRDQKISLDEVTACLLIQHQRSNHTHAAEKKIRTGKNPFLVLLKPE